MKYIKHFNEIIVIFFNTLYIFMYTFKYDVLNLYLKGKYYV